MEANSAVRAIHARELERLRHAAICNKLAIAAAMEYCAEYQVTPPPWLLRMSADLMIDLLKREKGKKRGRAAGYIARHRQDMIDFERWNEVVVTRERQVRICEEVETCKQCLDPDDKFRIDREKMHAWLGHTWERAFECATIR